MSVKNTAKRLSEKPRDPRPTAEINAAYTELAKQLGDVVVREEGAKAQKNQILAQIDALGSEMRQRVDLDNKAKEKNDESAQANKDEAVGQRVEEEVKS